MEGGDGIGLVLARAFELRSNITNCIHRASSSSSSTDHIKQPHHPDEDDDDNLSLPLGQDDDEETESLLDIRDAFESLESQLSTLQVLQQQQWYEKEAALSEIDHNRKKLLKKLKEYKGEKLEVICEATAFVSEAVEDSSDLLLPPYPSRPPRSLLSNIGYPSQYPSTSKAGRSVVIGGDSTAIEVKNERRNYSKGFWFFINSAAKTVIFTVGVISVLNLGGFETKLRRKDTLFNVLNLFQPQQAEEAKRKVQCPPGKVVVVESGRFRCIVKERVEIPFESVVATPDVRYGCG